MKKIIATIAASVLSVAAMAQKPGDGVLRIHTTDGEVTPIFTKNIKSMTFEEVTPLTMNIDVEETGTDYILVDFPMPEGCSHWLMYVGDEELVGDDRDIRIEDEFGISDSAVKKQARSYKSVIKLDRNFHIYVHGNRNLLEQGEDEKGKFYKVYYEEEE